MGRSKLGTTAATQTSAHPGELPANSARPVSKHSRPSKAKKRAPRKTSFQRSKESDRDSTDSITTKDKILEAAKQHFADFGLAHASVRAITKIAGVNSALLRYYFGSKRALYEEVVHNITKRLVEVRIHSLEQLRAEHSDAGIPVEELLLSYAAPLFPRAVDDLSQDAAIYLRFFGRVYTEASDDLTEIIQSKFTDLQKMYVEELIRSLPDLTRETVIFRFGMLIGSLTFLGSKVGIISILSNGRFDENDHQEILSRFVASYAALFRAPDEAPPAR